MILAIVAVGTKYVQKVTPHLSKFIENGWDIRVLSDQPHLFPNLKTHKYPSKIFSYIDKLLFPLRLVEELEQSVMYIDADCFDFISDELILNFEPTKEVLYFDLKNFMIKLFFFINLYTFFKVAEDMVLIFKPTQIIDNIKNLECLLLGLCSLDFSTADELEVGI